MIADEVTPVPVGDVDVCAPKQRPSAPPVVLHGATGNQVGDRSARTADGLRPWSPALPAGAAEGGDRADGSRSPVTPQPREHAVPSLCGRKMVWTDDRSCGCNRCELRR